MKLIIGIFIIALIAFESIECNIVLKPIRSVGQEAALVFVQGASIPAKHYTKYAAQLQDKFNGSLWVVLTEFIANTPEPLQIDSVMKSAFDELQRSGFTLGSTSNIFFAGHSLGGIMIEDYVLTNLKNFPFSVKGLILEGSFVSRSKVQVFNNTQDLFVLTLGAELDGLARVTRIAESHYVLNRLHNGRALVITLPGMNHFQFAGEGNPPSNVLKNDIKPEITNEQARDMITDVTKAFMNYRADVYSIEDRKILSDYAAATENFVKPLIDAFKLEGFYHLVPPCSQNPGQQPPDCLNSSPWTTSVSQLNMSSLNSANLIVTDSLRSVVGIPEKFPSINNKCQFGPGAPACVVNVSTITENVYDFMDTFDVGLNPIAAVEVRTKMESRQSVLQAFTNQKFDFNMTDETGNRCGDINRLSLQYALDNVPQQVLNRYKTRGTQLRIGSDVGPVNNGFMWINDRLNFTKKTDSHNTTYVEVRSPTLRTPTDYWITFVAGYHYCKILSPARAVEWLYIDSLKPQNQ